MLHVMVAQTPTATIKLLPKNFKWSAPHANSDATTYHGSPHGYRTLRSFGAGMRYSYLTQYYSPRASITVQRIRKSRSNTPPAITVRVATMRARSCTNSRRRPDTEVEQEQSTRRSSGVSNRGTSRAASGIVLRSFLNESGTVGEEQQRLNHDAAQPLQDETAAMVAKSHRTSRRRSASLLVGLHLALGLIVAAKFVPVDGAAGDGYSAGGGSGRGREEWQHPDSRRRARFTHGDSAANIKDGREHWKGEGDRRGGGGDKAGGWCERKRSESMREIIEVNMLLLIVRRCRRRTGLLRAIRKARVCGYLFQIRAVISSATK